MEEYKEIRNSLMNLGFPEYMLDSVIRAEDCYKKIAESRGMDADRAKAFYITTVVKLFDLTRDLKYYLDDIGQYRISESLYDIFEQAINLVETYRKIDFSNFETHDYIQLGAYVNLPENIEYIEKNQIEYTSILYKYIIAKVLEFQVEVFLSPCTSRELCKKIGVDDTFYNYNSEAIEFVFGFVLDNISGNKFELQGNSAQLREDYLKAFEDVKKLVSYTSYRESDFIKAKLISDEIIFGKDNSDKISIYVTEMGERERLIFLMIINRLIKVYDKNIEELINKYTSLNEILNLVGIGKTDYSRNKRFFNQFTNDFIEVEKLSEAEEEEKERYIKSHAKFDRKKLVKIMKVDLTGINADEKLTNMVNEFVTSSETIELSDVKVTTTPEALLARILYTDLVTDRRKLKRIEREFKEKLKEEKLSSTKEKMDLF